MIFFQSKIPLFRSQKCYFSGSKMQLFSISKISLYSNILQTFSQSTTYFPKVTAMRQQSRTGQWSISYQSNPSGRQTTSDLSSLNSLRPQHPRKQLNHRSLRKIRGQMRTSGRRSSRRKKTRMLAIRCPAAVDRKSRKHREPHLKSLAQKARFLPCTRRLASRTL